MRESLTDRIERGLVVLILELALVALILAGLLFRGADAPAQTLPSVADEYAGADGTLMGVPQGVGVYQVEDHDTGEQYLILVYQDELAIVHREGI